MSQGSGASRATSGSVASTRVGAAAPPRQSHSAAPPAITFSATARSWVRAMPTAGMSAKSLHSAPRAAPAVFAP